MEKAQSTKEVVITAYWGCSSLGTSPDDMIKNISEGKTGIKKSSRFKERNLEMYPIGSLDREPDFIDKSYVLEWTHKESIKAIKKALEIANLSVTSSNSENIGLAVASSTLKVLKMQEYVQREKDMKEEIPLLLMGDGYLQHIAHYFGIKGEVHNVSTACSSSVGAIAVAMDAILSGEQDAMIVVSADPLVELSVSGFASLQSLSEGIACPFDIHRNGINLGEAAVAFVLEDKNKAIQRGATIYASLLSYYQANDAYALTAPDPEGKGAARVMQSVIDQANILPSEVGYINAHGTGTKLNDTMELKAFEKLGFSCFISSTKAYTGHCLGTAGLLELLLCLESYRRKMYMPNYLLSEAESSERLLDYKFREEGYPIKPYILSNSFAFSGSSASILLRMAE